MHHEALGGVKCQSLAPVHDAMKTFTGQTLTAKTVQTIRQCHKRVESTRVIKYQYETNLAHIGTHRG